MLHQRDDNIIIVQRKFERSHIHLTLQPHDIYFLICKVEYPYDRKTCNETACISLPGTLVGLEFCAYLEFPTESEYYSYDPKIVNGIENAKVNLFLKELPSFIQIENNPFEKEKKQMKIYNYCEVP